MKIRHVQGYHIKKEKEEEGAASFFPLLSDSYPKVRRMPFENQPAASFFPFPKNRTKITTEFIWEFAFGIGNEAKG